MRRPWSLSFIWRVSSSGYSGACRGMVYREEDNRTLIAPGNDPKPFAVTTIKFAATGTLPAVSIPMEGRYQGEPVGFLLQRGSQHASSAQAQVATA
jgi:hypothetical protein